MATITEDYVSFETAKLLKEKGFGENCSELKESEDERIRKALIDGFTVMKESKNCGKTFSNYNIPVVDILAWLEKQGENANFRNKIQIGDKVTRNEDGVLVNLSQLNRVAKKQGEQKPADKIEPKFKVGDWIIGRATNNEPRQISEITDNYYKSTYGGQYGFSFEDEMHLWTIQDAKDGDVLATLDYILIFKEFLKNDGGISYCHYDFGAGNPQFIWFEDKNWYFGKEAIIYPATKEQRNLLFQKMKEDGYEWDAEKKELRKIEQNPAWSEEDEKYWSIVIAEFSKCAGKSVSKDEWMCCNDWLNSLRDRVQPQLKWSEEDEIIIKVLNSIIRYIVEIVDKDTLERFGTNSEELFSWLKSLRPQSTWKPSDEQMDNK